MLFSENTYGPTFEHTYGPTFEHTCVPTFEHIYGPTFERTCVPTFEHTYGPTFEHTCVPTFERAYGPTLCTGGSCGGLAIFVGGSDGKTLYNHVVTYDFNYNTSTPTGAKGDKHTYAVQHAATHARVGCLGDRFAVISGGASGRECVQTVSVLDTQNPPSDGTVLPVLATLGAGTGTLAVASLSNGEAVGFFDGVSMHLFTIEK